MCCLYSIIWKICFSPTCVRSFVLNPTSNRSLRIKLSICSSTPLFNHGDSFLLGTNLSLVCYSFTLDCGCNIQEILHRLWLQGAWLLVWEALDVICNLNVNVAVSHAALIVGNQSYQLIFD